MSPSRVQRGVPRAARDQRHDLGHGGGEPAWLAWIDSHAASALAHQGLAASIVLAAAFAIIAAGMYVSARSVIIAAASSRPAGGAARPSSTPTARTW